MGGALWPLPALLHSPSPLSGRELGLAYLALVGAGSLSLFLLRLALHGAGGSARTRGSSALTLAAMLACAPLCALAFALEVGTHHRPLGAATFALCALGGFGVLLLCALGLLGLRERRPRLGSALVYGAHAVGVLCVGLALSVLFRSVIQRATPMPSALDALVGLVLAGALVSFRASWLARSRLALAGVPLCCSLWLASLWLVRSDVDVRARVKSAPIVAGIVGIVVR
jgi:hypothetical protein